MSYKYEEGTIVDIINETGVVRRFFIKMPDSMNFTFRPGQFVMINLPIQSKYTNRSYSIASAPSNDNIFELCIVLKPTGLGTPFEWENFEVGTKVQVSKALGKFELREPIETDICFIGTGTGIAPLRSMLIDMHSRNVQHKEVYLVFGNRTEKDILYKKEFEDLEKKMPGFRFVPVLSRESEGWTGHKGYVHAVYEELFKDRRPARFYICGWSEMLKETRQRLEAMGYDKNSVFSEVYD